MLNFMHAHPGQLLEFVAEREDNEHWWEVKNEDGETGCVPSSYVIGKDEQVLPWLVESALKLEENERKVRVERLAQEKAALEGKGCGPAPKDVLSSLPPKVGLCSGLKPLNTSLSCGKINLNIMALYKGLYVG
jgi:hypothetical protein